MLRVLSLFNLQGANPSSHPPQPLSGTSSCGTPLFYHTARALSSTFFDPSKLFSSAPALAGPSRLALSYISKSSPNCQPPFSTFFDFFQSGFWGRAIPPFHLPAAWAVPSSPWAVPHAAALLLLRNRPACVTLSTPYCILFSRRSHHAHPNSRLSPI